MASAAPDDPSAAADLRGPAQVLKCNLADGGGETNDKTHAAHGEDRHRAELRRWPHLRRLLALAMGQAAASARMQRQEQHRGVNLGDPRHSQGGGERQKHEKVGDGERHEQREQPRGQGVKRVPPHGSQRPRVGELRRPGPLAESPQGHRVQRVGHQVPHKQTRRQGLAQGRALAPSGDLGQSDRVTDVVAPPRHHRKAHDEEHRHV
mmetsp:Transcript_5800/g.17153  ORF Transcript_5800/g.17153 Transcript_5800/m.17153 type:complete len:207 (+) Transcript_5800:376-996(+)